MKYLFYIIKTNNLFVKERGCFRLFFESDMAWVRGGFWSFEYLFLAWPSKGSLFDFAHLYFCTRDELRTRVLKWLMLSMSMNTAYREGVERMPGVTACNAKKMHFTDFFWQYCFGWLLLMLYESGYPFPLPASSNPFLSTTNDASLPILLPTSGARRMLVVLMEEKSASYDVCGKERDVLPLT